jgi:hypothetical protein
LNEIGDVVSQIPQIEQTDIWDKCFHLVFGGAKLTEMIHDYFAVCLKKHSRTEISLCLDKELD